MQIDLQRLKADVGKELLPLYILSGNEVLLLNEARDWLRNSARTAGHSGYSRQQPIAGESFDWESFLALLRNRSLFDDRQLTELLLTSKPLQEKELLLLAQYAERPDPATVLVICCAQLPGKLLQGKAFRKLDKAKAGVVRIWPIKSHQLPAWISKRLAGLGLQADRDAVTQLAKMSEGNLVVTAQAIEKLAISHPPGKQVRQQDILLSLSNSSRYSIFDLVDRVLAAKPLQSLKILQELREAGTAPALILWALAREIRSLHHGRSQENGLRRGPSAGRHPPRNAIQLRNLLRLAYMIDCGIKGLRPQALVWPELTELVLRFAGHPVLKGSPLT